MNKTFLALAVLAAGLVPPGACAAPPASSTNAQALDPLTTRWTLGAHEPYSMYRRMGNGYGRRGIFLMA